MHHHHFLSALLLGLGLPTLNEAVQAVVVVDSNVTNHSIILLIILISCIISIDLFKIIT